MRSKFEMLYENYSGKFTKGGFMPGDFVSFADGALNHPAVNAGSDDYKAKIEELIDSDAHLRIGSLSNTMGVEEPNADNTANRYVASIYQTTPGNSATSSDNIITIPLEVLNKVARSDQEAQMSIPKSFVNTVDNLSHTNKNKATAETFDSSYDDGKDWEGGNRSGNTGEMGEDLDEDSDAGKRKINDLTEESFDLPVEDSGEFIEAGTFEEMGDFSLKKINKHGVLTLHVPWNSDKRHAIDGRKFFVRVGGGYLAFVENKNATEYAKDDF